MSLSTGGRGLGLWAKGWRRRHVKALVGEVDFSFKVVGPDTKAPAASGNESSSNEDVAGGVAGKRKHA